ncbi:gliding motility-associated C-terminal domain-containing protein [Flavobacterium sp. F-65]|uniref:Gliding motility-associated C-terminal domain-containing protein n=1 Tax=Flavobacterium pisciphilum TaxID=2893755 RepID=A0ABS8N0C1_9FLAO|nr:gliding motility-associated C-terminal domain-containing protein [Flavobacterium sp. F-65]MCC9074470.1 gliding motility-associated C-terminal domain-containing protein [Flavobacterium sp. F-65]
MKKITLIKKNSFEKVFHRTSVLLLFLLGNFVMQGQATLPTFSFSVTPTAESCRNNGALTFSTTGTDPGATVTYAIYKAPNFTTAISTTTNNSLTGLGGGAYRVSATQSMAGHTSNSQVKDADINGDVSPLSITVNKTDVTCPNSGTINVAIKTGTPAATNAYKITGPMNVGPQSSSTFTGLIGGSYIVYVTDDCGETKAENTTLTVFTPKVVFADGTNGSSSYNSQRSTCNYADFRQYLTAGDNDNVMVYPLTFEYIVHPPDGSAAIVVKETITGPNHHGSTVADITTSIPFYTDPFVLDMKVTDACGNVFPATRNINNPAEVNAQVLPADCSGSYFSLGTRYMVSPLTYVVTSAPAGYPTGVASSSNLVGGVGNSVPNGVYVVNVTDACGVSIDETVNVSNPTPGLWVFQGIGCGAGNGSFSVSQNISTYTFKKAIITAGPSAFSTTYPYDAASYISADGYNVVFNDVAGGKYTVETTDSCGHILITEVTVIGYNQGTVVADKVQKCGSFDVNLSVTGDNLIASSQRVKYWLQIKDPVTGEWGHPQSGKHSSGIPNETYAESLTNGIQQGSWTAPGTYRIVKTFGTLELGAGVASWGYGRDCYDELSVFDFETMGLKVKDLYSFECADGTNYNVFLTGYDGVLPYKYAITTKDGAPFPVNNDTNNLFTGLTSGIYNFTITDACGNVVNYLLDIEKLGLPKLTAVNICNGSTTGKLSVDGVPYLNFSWTKDNDPTVLSTSSTLTFPTFNTATDTGTYHVRLTSSSPGSCVNVVLDYQITSNLDNPNSGANTSTFVCQSVTNLDLNTLLPATADPYGTWEETTSPSSGNLNGHLWSPSVSATGSFTFTYSVNGLCSGTSVSTYTIANTATPAAPTADITQPTCALATGTITVTAPVAATDITYTLTGTNPMTPSVSNTTGIFSGLAAGTYDVTASAKTCESKATSLTVNTQPVTPAVALFSTVIQPTCSTATGDFTITNYDATKTYTFTPNTGVSISTTGVVTAPEGTYTATVTDAISGCTSAASASSIINAQPITPAIPTLGTAIQPTCAVATGSFAITNYDSNYTYTVTPTTGTSISATGVVTAPEGSYTVTATLGVCVSPSSVNAVIDAQPETPAQPILSAVVQPSTCANPTGNFTITNYNAAYTYEVTPTIGVSVSATGFVTAPTGTYTVTATLGACTSLAASATIDGAPAAPAIALFSTVIQPTCATATGDFTITNYDATKTYTFTPNTGVSISATGVVTAPAGTYTATVTDAISGCTSAASASSIINAQPITPAIPTLGTAIQPTCAVATGSFAITNYDSNYTYTVTPTTGTSISATGVVTAPEGSYTVTATLGVCVSPSSANAVIDAQPEIPAQPVLSAVVQPSTCANPTGNFTITNYNAAYTYEVTPTIGVSVSATGVVTAPTGTYTVTATLGVCTSLAASATIDAAPAAPAIALFSTVIQPTCATATGDFTITNYDATKTYTFTPNTGVSISATGVVTAPAGTYTATVTDAISGCTSAASASSIINAQPITPAIPTLGTEIQPTCAVATGSFAITNYDSNYTYTVTPTTGTSISATGVVTAPEGSYTVTATLGVCVSPSSANAVINAQPETPAQPILSAVVQPSTCANPTGNFTITNYNAAYTYEVTPTAGVSVSATGFVTAPTGTYTVTATLGVCTSLAASATIDAAPLAPATALFSGVTQPTCSTATGSFTITNYDATKTYDFTPNTGVSVSTAGVVTAPAGTYTATVTDAISGCISSVSNNVVVQSIICAKVDDYTATPINGKDGGTTSNILLNDTFNGLPIVLSEVDLTGVTVPTGLTLNANGTITVDPNTPAGSYVVTYRICEKLNLSNCDTTTATVVVEAAIIEAIADDYTATPINGKNGGTTTSVLTNDTLNGLVLVPSEVNLTGVTVPTGLTLNADGTITVDPNTPTGNYEVTYRICEKLNPSNCDSTTATVVVATTVIEANDDDFTAIPINEKDGGTTPNVLENDTLNGLTIVPSEINLTAVTVPTGLTLNQDGTITVGPNTQAGNYEVTYRICEKLNPTNCDTATVTIVIEPSCIIEVFNAVSPNGDGENDLFKIDGLECFPDNTVEIYNRWGVLVFDRDHYNNSDRAFRGISEGRATINKSAELPVGTYYYILKYKDNASNGHSKAGYLYLNR